MKRSAAFGSAIAFLQMGLAGCASAASDVPQCSDKQLLGYAPMPDELQVHRKFRLPTITYPHGYEIGSNKPWGLTLRVRVDATGRVACYNLKNRFEEEAVLNPQRRNLLAELRQWRYQPFIRDGKAVAGAVVTEWIDEEEAPAAHRPLPVVPLDQVHISLERTACFGSCPVYKVEVHGDGRVVYNGAGYVDVLGEHTYQISPQRVEKLVESLRSKDIWSLRRRYRASITDQTASYLTLRLGDQVHELEDYAGQLAGMPQAVSEFEDEIDKLSEVEGFINLSRGAVERLKAHGFKFRSQAGADLLARAVSNKNTHDNLAMLQLIELGAPVVGAKTSAEGFSQQFKSLLEAALIGRRLELIDPLIQRGALETNGAADQGKIDQAFRAAIQGGLLAPIEKIWAIAGARPHPSLTFEDVSEDEPPVRKTAPVTLLLRHAARNASDWEGLAITKWLAARGCDIKTRGADGDTLLHIAARAGDANLVRYLLSQGLDPSTPGRYELPALGSTHNEDVALLLLEAGTDMSKMDDADSSFRRFAEYNHWARVIAWLDAH